MKKFIFFISLFLISFKAVNANVVTLTRNKIDNTYTYYYDANLGRDRFLNAEKYMFESNVAYCLELGKKISSNIYDFTPSLEEANIEDKDIEFIKLVSYYGYDYPGHNSDRYYMATQEIIWERLSKSSISWVKELNPSDYIDVNYEKSEILSLVSYHNVRPSFDGKEIEFVLGKEISIVDENNVLSSYYTSNKNVKVEGNRLIISNNIKDKEIIFQKKSYNDKVFFIYSSKNSQKMLSAGSPDTVESKLKLKLIGGSLKIEKLDKDNNSKVPSGEGTLNGAIYELFDSDNNLVDTLIIGKKEKVDNLPLGKYYLKEKTASKGYLLDKNIYEIEITENKLNIEISVYEEVIKRKVEIFKVYASDKTGLLVGEENISFEIYDKNNNLINTITTDQDGYASITLPFGKYTFKQINSTENYYKVDDFIVTIDSYDERPIYKLLANSEIKAKLKVIKKDLETGETILRSGAKFKIFDIKNNKFISFNLSYPENKIVSIFEVNENGFFVTPELLPSGDYILYEVDDKLNGYLYNKEGLPFSVNENASIINDITYGPIIEVSFYNKRVTGSINIIKHGESIEYKDSSYFYKNILLKDVKFNVYAKENIYINGNIKYKADTLVGEIKTGEEGRGSINNLPLGKYYIKETSSSMGNIISDEIYNVNLIYKDQYTEVVNYELVINNYLNKGKLTINKYETSTNIKIPNTLIEVHDTLNNIVYKGYTDQNGQIILEDLPYGDYYISEVEASTGYKILEDNIYFTIDKESTIIDLYNERIDIPNTGFNIKLYNIMALTSLVTGFLLIILFRKKKKIILPSILIILSGVAYFATYFYKYLSDYYNNKNSIDILLDNKVGLAKDEKYDYKAIIEIPSVGIKRGILDINNKYNDVKYNIELINYTDNSIILAAHNGNNYNSYFNNLNKLELGSTIKIYYKEKIYEYIYSDSYEIKKNGYADIYRNPDKKSIILITCSNNNNDSQIVYIGYLKKIENY